MLFPVRLMPRLEATFPNIRFRLTDPNELDLPEPGEDFLAIDTVDGLKDVREIGVDEIAAQKARSHRPRLRLRFLAPPRTETPSRTPRPHHRHPHGD